MNAPDSAPAKSRRVRTGERHLKCDEATPDCLNCRRSSRECKRGVRLNFIDLTCKDPPQVPPAAEWSVQFQDESRMVASEYLGGLSRYAQFDRQPISSPRTGELGRTVQEQRQPADHPDIQPMPAAQVVASLQAVEPTHSQRGGATFHPDLHGGAMLSRRNSEASFLQLTGPSLPGGYIGLLPDSFASAEDASGRDPSYHDHNGSDASTAASDDGLTGAGPPSAFGGDPVGPHPGTTPDTGTMASPTDKSKEQEYLSRPEEIRFMQVFISEVGVWMDSLDKEKHFSRQVPYHALKCPMLLNALLACGVRHLTLTQHHSDDEALFYYDTATTQLLRNLQNPERDTEECAATAVVLNVYEIMSEKPTQRMSHIAGARALIRECGWSAKSEGLGAACFWLNVGMELLSCLAFNWKTAWEPDQWGVDMDFESKQGHGHEEIWVHRLFYVVAKIANFRASIPKFQESSLHDEQIRLQARYTEWQRLKAMCDKWNSSCPRTMQPFGYLHAHQAPTPNSLFPNVWLIKRAAVVGRLYYHTAQCLLAQVNPYMRKDSEEARASQQHHAHQVCGIVAHTSDRAVASVSIRSIAIVAEILVSRQEQQDVVAILEKIDRETCWRLGAVLKGLKKLWGWENAGPLPLTPSLPSSRQTATTTMPSPPPPPLAPPSRQMVLDRTVRSLPASQTPIAVPRPLQANPLSCADFSLPNHPYQNWYEPPSRSNDFNSSQCFL